MMTKLPRLYVNDKFTKYVNANALSITQNIVPLSTASISLPRGEELPARSFVELFTPYGSAGMFRVRSPHNAYGQNYSTAELEHMVAEVGDYLVKTEISKMMAANTAVKTVFSYYKGSHWQLGNYSAIGSQTIALEAKYESVLNVLLSILEQTPECMMTFDFSTNPWKVNIVKRGTTVTSEGRLARNVTTATVSYDDSELVTRVWYQVYSKDKDGKLTSRWVSKDASTLKTYGIIEGTVQTSSDMTDAEINATVNAYLQAHKQPRTSVSIQGVELSQITGERVDKFMIGDLMRLAIPDYSLTVELNITSITWGDVFNTDTMMIKLGDEEDDVVTFLHNLDATGSGASGGSSHAGSGKAAGKNAQEWSEYQSDFQILNDQIYGYVQKTDKYGKILEQAGMDINSKGILIYAHDHANNLMSHINTQADRISLVVEGTGKNAHIKPASIVASINNDKSKIKISADHIELDGLVKMSTFNAFEGRVTNMLTGKARISTLFAGQMKVDGDMIIDSRADLHIFGYRVGWVTADGKAVLGRV